MHGKEVFFQTFIYLAAAVASVPVAKKLGMGSVLGYLFAGIIIGPFVLNLVGDGSKDVMHFAEFGVVMMLFIIGLELRPALLWQMKKSIFGTGGLQVLITAMLLAGISLLFKASWAQAIAIGLTFSLSSTAIVLQSLAEKNQMNTQAGKSSFSVLLFQDIAVIPILAILPLLANTIKKGDGVHVNGSSAEHANLISTLPGWMQVIAIFLVVAAIIIAGRYLVRYLFRYIAQSGLREIFTASALMLVVGIALAMNSVGLSPALGAFLGGVVLADNEFRHELEADIEPFKGILLGLFFISVGASINFNILIEKAGAVFLLLGILLIIKFIVLLFLGKRFNLKSGQEYLFAFSLAQAGEFGFVLISFSHQNSLFSNELAGLLLIVLAMSMLTTPFLLIFNEKVVQPWFIKKENEMEADHIDENENDVIIAGFGRFGVIVGRFLKANGINATVLDNNPDNIRMLRKFGFKVFYGDTSRTDLLETAGIKTAKVLVVAIDDASTSVEIIENVKKQYPDLKVFARAMDIRHAYRLMQQEVDGFKRENYYSALELGKSILYSLGFPKYQVQRSSNIFKYHDENVIKELYKLWQKDNKFYIKEAKRFSQEIETTLLAEKESSIHESDGAWDNTTLKEEVKERYGTQK